MRDVEGAVAIEKADLFLLGNPAAETQVPGIFHGSVGLISSRRPSFISPLMNSKLFPRAKPEGYAIGLAKDVDQRAERQKKKHETHRRSIQWGSPKFFLNNPALSDSCRCSGMESPCTASTSNPQRRASWANPATV